MRSKELENIFYGMTKYKPFCLTTKISKTTNNTWLTIMPLTQNLSKHWRLILFVFITVGLLVAFNEATSVLWSRWGEERYSHAPFVLALATYLIWIKRHELTDTNESPWLGVIFTIIASVLLILGELSALVTLTHYGIVVMMFGLMWTMLGLQTRRILIPFAHVLLVIPLPYMLDVMLSGKFQLMSSTLGVEMIRLMDIPVFRDGNIIDLGVYKLQVVEACSGLNYTYPLMTIGLMMAYMFRASMYARVALFLSTIPISIVMNSFRIALVALLVNHSGIEAAEGFMHYFEGWVIFFSCIAILLIEVKLFNVLTKKHRSLNESFDYLENDRDYGLAERNPYINKTPIYVATVLILISVTSTISVNQRNEIIPDRNSFVNYPLSINGWDGHTRTFQNGEDKILKLDDYFLATYHKNNTYVDVYYGYTASQRSGFVPHSPKACIPGGGWEISKASIETFSINEEKTLSVSRMLISKGQEKMLVYYWFPQRGRDLASEFPMKFALLYDSIMLNRTDGAIARFVTPVGKSISKSDERLQNFIAMTYPD
ncbi:VPLPA-CTERM-specific exosortase XrtD, partial [Methylophaga sp. UBA3996]